MKKMGIFFFCLVWIISAANTAPLDNKQIISYGKDLTPEEKVLIFRELPLPPDLKPEELQSVEVSNEEEWQLLKGLVSEDKIGAKAISSVYIEKLTEGQGLKVETKNLTFVTAQMFANALFTAGVRDANLYATAPREVSGTAALTGIYKAVESLTGKPLKSAAKQIGAQELVRTGELGEKVGTERAVLLVQRSKERILQEKETGSQKITQIVIEAAKEQNIALTDEEKNNLVNLLSQIKELNLNLNSLQTQLKNFEPKNEAEPESKPKSWLDRFIELVQSIINQVFSFAGKIFHVKS